MPSPADQTVATTEDMAAPSGVPQPAGTGHKPTESGTFAAMDVPMIKVEGCDKRPKKNENLHHKHLKTGPGAEIRNAKRLLKSGEN